MRTLTANELDPVHGGANDGHWHWFGTGNSGQAFGVQPPDTVGYRTSNILLGDYGYQGIVSYNTYTGAYNLGLTATDGGQTYNFDVGSNGGGGSFTDSLNGNRFSFSVDITSGGDLEMLHLQFEHDFGHEPDGAFGGALAAVQPSVR